MRTMVTHPTHILLMFEIRLTSLKEGPPLFFRVSAQSQVFFSQISASNSITGKSALFLPVPFFLWGWFRMVPYSPWALQVNVTSQLGDTETRGAE